MGGLVTKFSRGKEKSKERDQIGAGSEEMIIADGRRRLVAI
jgi:hypothetical protein